MREIPAVLDAAAHAASSGDLAAAESLLHEVLRLQEASVGPLHPDLASTFNNLAVVCEMASKPADAEQFYRRAYAIASASLDPDDPRVATSLNNLSDFCEARGVPLSLVAQVRAESVAVAVPTERRLASDLTRGIMPEAAPAEHAPAAVPADRADRVGPEAERSASSSQTASSRGVIVGVLAVLAVLAVAWLWRETERPGAQVEPAAAPVAIAPPSPAPPEATPPAVAPAPPPPAPPLVEAPERTPVTRPAASRETSTRVLEAMVCQSLSTGGAEWKCVAPSNPAAPGRLSFYTRVAVSEDIRVRHRWYHGDRLVQDVGLAVRASPTAGYRTFSRQTVSALGGGEWRVEVRTADGALLSEQRLVVR